MNLKDIHQRMMRPYKFFLYISKENQKKDPTKHQRIKESDFTDHKYWNKYIESYEKVLDIYNTKWIPWYIIPANVKYS